MKCAVALLQQIGGASPAPPRVSSAGVLLQLLKPSRAALSPHWPRLVASAKSPAAGSFCGGDVGDELLQACALAEFDPAGIFPAAADRDRAATGCSDARHCPHVPMMSAGRRSNWPPAPSRRRRARQRTNWRRSPATVAPDRRADRGGCRPAHRCDRRCRGDLRRALHRAHRPCHAGAGTRIRSRPLPVRGW